MPHDDQGTNCTRDGMPRMSNIPIMGGVTAVFASIQGLQLTREEKMMLVTLLMK